MDILQTIVPKETQALSRRLWLRGAKRLGILAFDAEQIAERAIDADEARSAVSPDERPTLFGASLYRTEPATSPLTPAAASKGAGLPPAQPGRGLTLPTASYWAFGKQNFSIPERLQAESGRKRYKLSVILTRSILPPPQRTAHGQAFLEFAKWEIARLITEALPKYEVTYLIQESAENEAWEHYDIILRSRKPELVKFLTGATADEQMALAMGSDAVLTDHFELGAAVLGHGRKAVVLGSVEQPHGLYPAGAGFLQEWSFDRSALEQLISPLPKGKPGSPDYIETLQNTITQELASGCRWFEA